MGVFKILYVLLFTVGVIFASTAFLQKEDIRAKWLPFTQISESASFGYWWIKYLFTTYFTIGTLLHGFMIPYQLLDIYFMRFCPPFFNILGIFMVRTLGAMIQWVLTWPVRPTKKRDSGYTSFFFKPISDLVQAAPLVHGTIFRLSMIPAPIGTFILAGSKMSFTNWMKTSMISNVFMIPLLQANSMSILHFIKEFSDVGKFGLQYTNWHLLIKYGATALFFGCYIISFIVARMGPTKSPLAPPEKMESKRKND